MVRKLSGNFNFIYVIVLHKLNKTGMVSMIEKYFQRFANNVLIIANNCLLTHQFQGHFLDRIFIGNEKWIL